MITYHQFQKFYPSLYSCFAQLDTTSPTYTRKTKTGKMSVVRKGKRKKKGINPLLAASVVLGHGVAGGYLGYKGAATLDRKVPFINKLGSKTQVGAGTVGALIGATAALGTGLGLVGGALVLNKIRKKRNNGTETRD